MARASASIPHDNLCLIRSGQDWGDTEAAERKMYLDDVEPVLREGMDFLRDEGRSIGCYANRYMTVVGSDGAPTEKSYGMSWWKSLSALERWSESHPTHVQDLRRRHEISVDARAGRKAAALSRGHRRPRRRPASSNIVDCHPQTGMLNAVVEQASVGA